MLWVMLIFMIKLLMFFGWVCRRLRMLFVVVLSSWVRVLMMFVMLWCWCCVVCVCVLLMCLIVLWVMCVSSWCVLCWFWLLLVCWCMCWCGCWDFFYVDGYGCGCVVVVVDVVGLVVVGDWGDFCLLLCCCWWLGWLFWLGVVLFVVGVGVVL